jgi:hypothetical protein
MSGTSRTTEAASAHARAARGARGCPSVHQRLPGAAASRHAPHQTQGPATRPRACGSFSAPLAKRSTRIGERGRPPPRGRDPPSSPPRALPLEHRWLERMMPLLAGRSRIRNPSMRYLAAPSRRFSSCSSVPGHQPGRNLDCCRIGCPNGAAASASSEVNSPRVHVGVVHFYVFI